MNMKNPFKKKFIIHYLGHAYNDIYFLILPLLLPFLRNEFGLNYFYSGLILTTHIGVRSVFSYISGHLGDKYDKRQVIAFGFIFASICMAALMWAHTYFTVVVSLMIMAIGVAAFHPLATALVGEGAESEHRTLQIGVFESIGASGIIVSTLAFGFLVGAWGWRQTCLVIAIPGIPMAIAYLKTQKEKIKTDIEAETKVDIRNILSFLAGRGIRALGIGAIMSFLPTFAAENLGLSGGNSSLAMTLFFVGCIMGNLVGGWIADRKTELLVLTSATILTIPVLLGLTYLKFTFLALVLILIIGASHGGFFAPQNSWLTTVSTQSTRGKVLGAGFLMDGISVTIAPTLFGWIADRIGLVGSFRWTLVPIVISLFFFLRLYYLEYKNSLSSEKSTTEVVSSK